MVRLRWIEISPTRRPRKADREGPKSTGAIVPTGSIVRSSTFLRSMSPKGWLEKKTMKTAVRPFAAVFDSADQAHPRFGFGLVLGFACKNRSATPSAAEFAILEPREGDVPGFSRLAANMDPRNTTPARLEQWAAERGCHAEGRPPAALDNLSARGVRTLGLDGGGADSQAAGRGRRAAPPAPAGARRFSGLADGRLPEAPVPTRPRACRWRRSDPPAQGGRGQPLPVVAGRLRDGLRLLRDRPDVDPAQPGDLGDHRPVPPGPRAGPRARAGG